MSKKISKRRSSKATSYVAVATSDDYERIFREPGHLIRRLHQISTSIFLAKMRELEVTPVQFVTLLAIDVFPGIDQTRLAKAVAHDRATISNVVKRMQAKGLIRCDRANRRTNALYLLGAGRAVMHAVIPRSKSVHDSLLSALTASERAEFLRLLHKLVDSGNALSRAPLEPFNPK